MRDKQATNKLLERVLLVFGAAALLGATGCQSTMGGQTLPSPFYLSDDVQYHQPGPEFKLAKEAAAQKAFQEDQAAAAGPAPGPPVPVPPPAPAGPPPGPAVGASLFTPRYW